MAHSWESPANAAREALLETLESYLPEHDRRTAIIELAIEEFERQFADPDDEMIIAGQETLDAAGMAFMASLYYRRSLIENIWRRMAMKAFGR
jgi:hypothetical protein